ncbi:hypothetical protein llap_457 [Limosa lapponica baueri]|uniref:Uncharacterized protein n=1 Tax=Limosa lapponica baueri TaxID=1758121 RepID=A0A2I0UT98_LIMLA|nr:hypothetical protein llap_457 [Limosa lapponica baueri]
MASPASRASTPGSTSSNETRTSKSFEVFSGEGMLPASSPQGDVTGGKQWKAEPEEWQFEVQEVDVIFITAVISETEPWSPGPLSSLLGLFTASCTLDRVQCQRDWAAQLLRMKSEQSCHKMSKRLR